MSEAVAQHLENGTISLTVPEAIRAALLEVPDPQTADRNRILVIARTKLHEAGVDNPIIDAERVSKCRSYLIKKIGKPLTHSKIHEYIEGCKGDQKHNPYKRKKIATTTISGLTDFLSLLTQARKLAEKAGGVKNLINLLEVLGE